MPARLSAVRTALTLLVLVALLAGMAVVGYQRLFAPLPNQTGASTSDTCQNEKRQTTIARKQVTVSVYNATSRKGFADRTMSALEARGFRVGSVGNAPDGPDVTGVEIRTGSADSPSAKLLAQQFDPPGKVVASEDELGPGVDVILGKGSRKPAQGAPAKIKLDQPIVTCLDDQVKSTN